VEFFSLEYLLELFKVGHCDFPVIYLISDVSESGCELLHIRREEFDQVSNMLGGFRLCPVMLHELNEEFPVECRVLQGISQNEGKCHIVIGRKLLNQGSHLFWIQVESYLDQERCIAALCYLKKFFHRDVIDQSLDDDNCLFFADLLDFLVKKLNDDLRYERVNDSTALLRIQMILGQHH
jgi:hypothetical protein